MNYTSIDVQGNILSSEILEKIRTEDIRFQKPQDFGLSSNAPVRDEISLAWNLAVSNWNAFKLKRESIALTDSGTTETRKYWLQPLMNILGYELQIGNAEVINGKSYAISHRAQNLASFPLHLVGIHQSLDKRPDTGGTRLSAHALVQEYANNTEHMYALVSNGRFLRLIRDATRLSRLSYLEFDLEQMMEEGLYVEFALLYRTLHASRMPQSSDTATDSFIEFYHQEALSSGSRIRERLSKAVENSIKELANGILHEPANQDLRDLVISGKITPKDYYLYTLRLVYRMLFLLVIEERKLIYADKRDEELNKKRSIYYDYYSIQRLTKLAVKMVYIDPRKSDLWQSLLTTFALFEEGKYGQKLGIEPLGSGLFSPNALDVLSEQLLDNETLLKVLRYLVTFENERGQRVRVNYADLDVEEFGSVYEGLLEYDPVITDTIGQPVFGFVHGDARSSSGSHYTPEELVKPLITHSLDYLIADKLKEADPEAGLLSLSICDVACGSGHILLSAARRVGFELAKVRSREDQPTPSVLRVAIRDVIRHCIYGVDLNPLAVELCKVALWLEAHEPGQPMNFLDHRIKCGNAIVGLAHVEELEKGIASEAFKTLPSDEKEVAASFKKRNDAERKTINQLTLTYQKELDNNLADVQKAFTSFAQLPENTPEQIANKEKAYKDLTSGVKWWRLKQLADLQVAQFFIPKTNANKESLTTDAQYRKYLSQGLQISDRGASLGKSANKRFFHWFLEFPQVFQKGGFDCVLGNPPFLGGSRISGKYGDVYLNFIKSYYTETSGNIDLIGYFFKRISSIIANKRFFSLISTNTISQGDTRINCLDSLLNNNFIINYALPSMKWPGKAAVEISILTLYKGKQFSPKIINKKFVDNISSLLDDSKSLENPLPLNYNLGLSSLGTNVNGQGFILDEDQYRKIPLIEREVVKPYINGQDLNNLFNLTSERYIINFKNFEEEYCKNKYPYLYDILSNLVKPERLKLATSNSAYKKWWLFERARIDFYDSIKSDKLIGVTQVSKTCAFVFLSTKFVFDQRIVLINHIEAKYISFLQSSIHIDWAWKYGSTMKSDLTYNSSVIFQTYPFPKNLHPNQEQNLETIGENYHEHRRLLMLEMQLGLTKTYNLFHAASLQGFKNLEGFNTNEEFNPKTFEKTYGKDAAYLFKHLLKTFTNESLSQTVPRFTTAVNGIIKLRELHVQMDEAVLDAYGWGSSPIGEAEVRLRHDFYEVDYLPENDRVRFTIHPDARKEVLKRLLELNHTVYEQEIREGLHKEEDVKKFYEQKGVPIPAEVILKMAALKLSNKTNAKKAKPKKGFEGMADMYGEQ